MLTKKSITLWGGYLDCYQVNINRNIDDFDINVSDNNNCDLAILDNIANQIKVYAYEGENGVILNYLNIGSNKNINWTNKDVYLFLDPNTLPDENFNNLKITWSSNNVTVTKERRLTSMVSSDESYANIYKVETKLLFDAIITVKVELNNVYYTQKVNVKIDRENPILTLDTNVSYEKMDEQTKKATKIINFSGSDGSGSGIGISKNNGKIAGYFLTDDANYIP